jgi:hypothetical protein
MDNKTSRQYQACVGVAFGLNQQMITVEVISKCSILPLSSLTNKMDTRETALQVPVQNVIYAKINCVYCEARGSRLQDLADVTAFHVMVSRIISDVHNWGGREADGKHVATYFLLL